MNRTELGSRVQTGLRADMSIASCVTSVTSSSIQNLGILLIIFWSAQPGEDVWNSHIWLPLKLSV